MRCLAIILATILLAACGGAPAAVAPTQTARVIVLTATPEAAPTAPIPAESVPGIRSADVQTYLAAVGTAMQTYGVALGKVGERIGSLATDPMLIRDQEWSAATAFVLTDFKNAGQTLGNIQEDVPPEAVPLDAVMKKIADETLFMVDDFVKGSDAGDVELLNSASGRLKTITALINEATAEARKLKGN